MMIASVALSILICVYLFVCYFPGGRNRRDVIDIGDLPKYNLSAKAVRDEDDDGYDEGATETDYTRQNTEEFYEQVELNSITKILHVFHLPFWRKLSLRIPSDMKSSP